MFERHGAVAYYAQTGASAGMMKMAGREEETSGLTGLVLALGAIVSQPPAEVIREALGKVPTKTVLTWCREKLGKTLHATRRTLFVSQRKAEQKPD